MWREAEAGAARPRVEPEPPPVRASGIAATSSSSRATCLAEDTEVRPHGEDPARLLEHAPGGFPVSQRHVGVRELDSCLDREPGQGVGEVRRQARRRRQQPAGVFPLAVPEPAPSRGGQRERARRMSASAPSSTTRWASSARASACGRPREQPRAWSARRGRCARSRWNRRSRAFHGLGQDRRPVRVPSSMAGAPRARAGRRVATGRPTCSSATAASASACICADAIARRARPARPRSEAERPRRRDAAKRTPRSAACSQRSASSARPRAARMLLP